MSLRFAALTSHLWVAKCRGYAMNTGIVHSGRHAALIDPALLPDEVEDIAAFCEQKHLEVEFVVITHHHWDHVLGAARFPGARIVTHQAYLAETAFELEHTRSAIRRFYEAQGVAVTAPFVPPVPEFTFDRGAIIQAGRMSIDVIHTPGHARDHASLYDTSSALLWAGDLLSNLEIPFVSDRLDAYERTLDLFAAMDIRVLVPGHGSVTRSSAEIQRRIAADRRYLAGLRARIEPVVQAGGSVQDAVSACAGMVFRHPAANAEPHAMNVEQVFLEFGGSAPPNTLLGWSREL